MYSLSHYWDLTLVLTRKEIKVRYKNHVLGYLWSVANPLAFTLILYMVFTMIKATSEPKFPIFLITGLIPWQWFSNSVGISPTIFRSNASIIKKINFPRSIIPLAMVLQDMIHFILSIPVIVLFLLIFREAPSLSWLYGIPLLLLIHLFLTYGIVLIISSINLFFRDMEKLTNIFIMLLFYCTPIFYSVDKIPHKYRLIVDLNPQKLIVYLNPLAPLIINWRNLLLHGSLELHYLVVSVFHAALAAAIGYLIYKKLSWKFAEVI